jgi:hypothetical protein
VITIFKSEGEFDYKFVYTTLENEYINICIKNTSQDDPTYVSFRFDSGHYAGDKQSIL